MPTIDENILAEQYGFAWSVLNGNPELKAIFQKAVKETWTADKFVASVRGTGWYKSTAESVRNAQMLQASDPATYANQLAQVRARVGMMAAEFGARMSGQTLNQIAEQTLQGGWDDNQLRQTLSGYVEFSGQGNAWGQAGLIVNQLREYARSMGVNVSEQQLQEWTTRSVRGEIVPEDAQTVIKEAAAGRYVAFRDRILAGESMESIAEPYRQSMGAMWEINPQSKDIMDPMIQRALTAVDPKTGQPAAQPLWQFEIDLRKDPMYNKTSGAQKSAMETGRQVLRDFGLQA